MPANGYPASVCPGIPKLGPRPKGWKTLSFNDAIEIVSRPAKIEDEREYQLVIAKRNRIGVVPRTVLKGELIKTKTQFYVRSGDFLIANRQIVHGGCGLVPDSLDGAIVSNEYTTLRAKSGVWLPFFSYFSHSTHFQQTCFHSSIGVDVEKMVFKLRWWLKHQFHLPPLNEQIEISNILSAWDNIIKKTSNLLAAKQRRKKALMQQLLTGKRRLPGFQISPKKMDSRYFSLPQDWQCPHIKKNRQRKINTQWKWW